MKKFAKMSLVAAVAVAGMTTANAKDLAEAIKGVDVSGTMVYRYDDRDQYAGNTGTNSYKIALTVKAPVNDDLTAVTKTIIGSGNGMASIAVSASDSEAGFALSQANFVYTGFANTSIIAGKQAVPSPFAVQADAAGDEDTGAGLTVVSTLGPVTLAGTYLNQTNLDTVGAALAGAGIMANVGPVALDAWYLDVADTTNNDGHQAFTIGASTKIDVVSLYGRYSTVDHDATNEDESLWKVGAKAKIGIFGFGVDYGQTNDVASYQTGVELTGDSDAPVAMQGWATNLDDDDTSLLKVNANVDVMEGLNFSVTYAAESDDETANSDVDEVYGQLTYKMGKNFMTYLRIGQVDDETQTDEGTRGRLHVQYSF